MHSVSCHFPLAACVLLPWEYRAALDLGGGGTFQQALHHVDATLAHTLLISGTSKVDLQHVHTHTHTQEDAPSVIDVRERRKEGVHYSDLVSQELWVPESHRTGHHYTDFAHHHIQPNNE